MTDPIYIKRVLENVIKRTFGELNNIFHSQRMSDSFYRITEASELN